MYQPAWLKSFVEGNDYGSVSINRIVDLRGDNNWNDFACWYDLTVESSTPGTFQIYQVLWNNVDYKFISPA